MIITILVIVHSPQSHLIFVPFKIDFLNVFENFTLLSEESLFSQRNLFKKNVKNYIYSIFSEVQIAFFKFYLL